MAYTALNGNTIVNNQQKCLFFDRNTVAFLNSNHNIRIVGKTLKKDLDCSVFIVNVWASYISFFSKNVINKQFHTFGTGYHTFS